jgi:hypothetical protein
MSMRDVPPAQWPQFLDEFSRQHRAWLATIERTHAGSLAHIEAVERPLASVTPQVMAGGVAGIEIRLQDDSQASPPIRILAPRTIRVDESPRGTAQALEIIDEQDERTRIRFRAAPLAEMLDGVAPGELPPR